MSFDNNGQLVMGKVVSDNPNAPKMRVNLEWNGEKLKCGLWPMTRKDGTPVKDKAGNQLYKGTLEVDNYQQQQQPAQQQQQPAQQQQQPAQQQAPHAGQGFENFDDDIPF
jgi:hypothetical protein